MSAASQEQHESLSYQLWNGCQAEALAALYTPFVRGLAAGVLPISAFQHYVAQDAFFLDSFAETYKLTLAKIPGKDVESRDVLHQQLKACQDELQLHTSYAEAWGVDLANFSTPSDATSAYTNFLAETAGSESANPEGAQSGEDDSSMHATAIVAAMVPCMRLYAFVGKEVKQFVASGRGLGMQVDPRSGEERHRYGEWIETYASEAFEASAVQLESLLDRLAGPSPLLASKEHLLGLYRKAMTLEGLFFSSQPVPSDMKLPTI
eukprot:TRINITY_DN39296_c0_g1_i1.p1 TRINITY_DN39296_c0_g1~~TRINITY_DN39296_c0_g1_i1.p1  ORF type:complete len:264 (-),score=47.46 TRINITY_DN39296_c0_g1_i1:246-1037(-)